MWISPAESVEKTPLEVSVVVDIPRVAGAALTAEVGPAIAAEQLGREQVIVLGLVAGRGLFVFRQFLCTRSKRSWGTMAGMPSGTTMSR